MRLPGHPSHPPLVHFPIALLGTSLAFDAVGLWRGEELWWSIAFWNICLGLTVSLATAATGFLDSLEVADDSPASSYLNQHVASVVGALSCYGVAVALRKGPGLPEGAAFAWTLVFEAAGLGLLLLAGSLGGKLVYRHGVGQARREPPSRPVDIDQAS